MFGHLCERLKEAKKVVNLKTCVNCGQESDVSHGMKCSNISNRHFYCKECFEGMVHGQVVSETFIQHDDHIVCRGCLDLDPSVETKFEIKDISSRCSSEIFDFYDAARVQSIESRVKHAALQLHHSILVPRSELTLGKPISAGRSWTVFPCTWHGATTHGSYTFKVTRLCMYSILQLFQNKDATKS